MAKCEFKTYRNGAEFKGDEYYLWNVRANANESAYQLKRKLIYKLLLENECLVVFEGGQALVADSFAVEREYALRPNTFSGVSASSLDFQKTFDASEVLYFRYGNTDVKQLLELYYGSYQKMLEASIRAFARTRGERGTVTINRNIGDPEYEERAKKLVNASFSSYFKGDDAVLSLPDGYAYSRNSGSSGARELSDAGDTRKLVNDILDMTALAFRIPPALLRGEMADLGHATNNFLTFCIDPICRMLETELTGKRYDKDKFFKGEYLKINTTSVKHVDLLDSATAIDKLISSGVFSINDLLGAVGAAKIPESWADKHYMTLNYADIEELGKEVKANEQND